MAYVPTRHFLGRPTFSSLCQPGTHARPSPRPAGRRSLAPSCMPPGFAMSFMRNTNHASRAPPCGMALLPRHVLGFLRYVHTMQDSAAHSTQHNNTTTPFPSGRGLRASHHGTPDGFEISNGSATPSTAEKSSPRPWWKHSKQLAHLIADAHQTHLGGRFHPPSFLLRCCA